MTSLKNYDRISDFKIRAMESADIPSAIKMHKEILNYSLNSRLGLDHLYYIYETTHHDSHSIIYLAFYKERIVGVAVATMDPERLQKKLINNLTIKNKIKLICRFFLNLKLAYEFFEDKKRSSPVVYKGEKITPCLFVLAIDKYFRRAGIGKLLITYVENYFRDNKCYMYHTDTRENNIISLIFYNKLGFLNVEKRGANIILVKEILANV